MHEYIKMQFENIGFLNDLDIIWGALVDGLVHVCIFSPHSLVRKAVTLLNN
jgi:hypothetical protein